MSLRKADPTLWSFGAAFLHNWFTAMSGPLSVPLAIAAFWVTSDTAKALLGVSAFACVWAAAYGVWRHERIALNEEKTRADAALSQFNETRCILSVATPRCVSDAYGNEKWQIRVTNNGPAVATAVQMKLIDVNPAPENAQWVKDQCPHKVILTGSTFDAPAPRIAATQSEVFEPIMVLPNSQNRLASKPIGNIEPRQSRQITIEIGEQWRLNYTIFAENSNIVDVALKIYRRTDGSVTVEGINGYAH